MSQNFRRDLNREFDSISGSPSPALSARVRSAVVQDRPARTGPFWMAGLAAALIAIIVVGVLVVASFNRHQTGVLPGTAPSPSASPSASPSPVATPTSNLPAFVCGVNTSLSPQQAPPSAYVSDVRTGTHAGYDRITITFTDGLPGSISLKPQNSATFNPGHHVQRGRAHVLHGADGFQGRICGAGGGSPDPGLRGLRAVGPRA